MYRQYQKDVAFYVVYIGEAHPSDAWQVTSNLRDKVIYASPTNAAERTSIANVCVVGLGIKLPALIDRFDDATDTAYQAGRIASI